MNKTRKQIIELIWDYMEKDLSEGCYIQTQIWLYKYLWEEFESNNFKWWPNYLADNWKWIVNFNKNTITKIIWHYSITSVLKYICSLWYDFEGDFRLVAFEDDIKINTIDDYGIPSGEYIPNKPLHLYTEAEEKELLELLLKLK